MLGLNYTIVIETTEDPNFFAFYSPDLEGFTGVGNSIEDCICQATWGIAEHVALLQEHGLPVPSPASYPRIIIQDQTPVLQIA